MDIIIFEWETENAGNKFRRKTMKEKVKDILLTALEKELEVEGDEVRTYFIDTLVDCILRLEDEEAPQVEAEEQGSSVIKTKDSITSKVGISVVTITAAGVTVQFLE